MPTIRQEINIVDGESTLAGADSKARVQLDTTQYVSPTYYFEVVFNNATSVTGSFTLRRAGTTTDDATLTINQTNYPNGTTTRFRGSFTPPAGQTEYMFHDARSASSGTRTSARIIVIDNPTTLTSTETQIEIGMNKTGLVSTTATKVVPDTTLTKYWKYTAANWDGTTTFYAEVTYLMASSKSSGTFVLQEDDGAFANWTDKVTIVSAGVASAATRVRSASFTPTDGRNYRIAYLVASSKSAASIFNAKIIVDQTGSSAIEDSYSEANQDNQILLQLGAGSGTTKASQSFQTTNAAKLSKATFYIKKGGAPTGNATAVLYAHSGTFGTSSVPTGSALATSDPLDVSTLTTSFALKDFTFSGVAQIILSAATNYCISIEYGAGDISNDVIVGYDNSSPTHGGNQATFASSVWTANSGRDTCFYVYLLSSSPPTLLEPQYLLLNTADSNATGVQSYPTLWDSTEWSGVTNVYTHAMDSDNASNSAKLRDITGAVDITSTVTGANQQISTAITMPTTGHEIDTWILNTTGVVGADRILVASTVSAGPATLTINVSDTATISETVTKMVESYVNTSDSGAISESIDVLRAGARDVQNISDTATITETVTKELNSFVNMSDTATITEAPTLLETSFVSVTDSPTITETTTRLETSFINVSDTATITETATPLVPTLLISVTDSSTITESQTLLETSFISVTDSPAITESATLLETSFVNVLDGPSITESAALLEISFISVTDSATITETQTLLITSFISKTDTATITETPTVTIAVASDLSVSVSDSATITETTTLLQTSFISLSDTPTITESATLLETAFISKTDSATITETVTPELNSFISVSDTPAITEFKTLLEVSSINVADSLTVTETAAELLQSFINASDTVTISETTSLLIPTLFISVTESITISETFNVFIQVQGAVSVSDSVAITETVTLLIPTLFLSVTDSTSLTETVVLDEQVKVNVSDTATITENTTRLIPELFLSVSDNATVTETTTQLLTSFINASDSAGVTETPQVSIFVSTLSINVSDSAQLSETVTIRGFTPPTALTISLSGQSTSLTLKASYTSLTLTQPQVLAITLSGRPSNLTLKGEATDLNLSAQPTSLTLKT